MPDVELSALFDFSSEVFAVFDVGGRLVWWNRALPVALDYPEEELARRDVLDLVHPGDTTPYAALAAALDDRDTVVTTETRLRCRNGSWQRWVWTAARHPATGETYAVARRAGDGGGSKASPWSADASRCVDRVARPTADPTPGPLVDSSAVSLADPTGDPTADSIVESIMRASPDIVVVFDRNGRVVSVSDAVSRVLGVDDRCRHEWTTLVHPDDRGAFESAIGRLLCGVDGQLDQRLRVRHARGHWVSLQCRGRPIVEDRAVAGAAVVVRDVTEELERTTRLQQAVHDAEGANEAKSRFLSRMSHELRTPLNSVLGFAQLLEMDPLDPPVAEAVAHIRRAGRHLLGLIDDVLDVAGIETGRVELSLGPVPLADIVDDAVDLTRHLAQDGAVDARTELVERRGPIVVHADRQRLLQVLVNLLSNAMKYNHRGGWVRLHADVAGPGRVRIEVSDSGPGIPPESLHRVFEPFDRLGAEHTGIEGTGVGLTLTKHLVERMGGAISVDSPPGRDTTFTVELNAAPVELDAADPHTAPAASAAPATEGPRRRRAAG